MANAMPDFLPTYLLPNNSSPVLADSVLLQNTSSETSDIGLALVSDVLDAAIDSTTIDIYTALGWGGVS